MSHFQDQKVKGQLAGAGAYCGGLPHSLLMHGSLYVFTCYILHYLASRLTMCVSYKYDRRLPVSEHVTNDSG